MPDHQLNLLLLPNSFAVCRQQADAPFPAWAKGDLVSITRTRKELSIVCQEDAVPAGIQQETGWRCLGIRGPLDFALIGVLASLLRPLANAEVGVSSLVKRHSHSLTVAAPKCAARLRSA